MKLLVSTTTAAFYVDPQTHDEIPHNRPCVAGNSNFLQGLIARGLLTLHCGDLSDEATDEDFKAFFKASEDKDLAISSFISKHSTSIPAEIKSETTPAKPKAAAAKPAAAAAPVAAKSE